MLGYFRSSLTGPRQQAGLNVLHPNMLLAEGGVGLIQIILLFAAAAIAMGLGVLLFGKLLRPKLDNPEKQDAYECGEVPVGGGWVQFDLRFYVVALLFLVFDIEIALFYPWAVVYGGGGAEAPLTWEALREIRWVALWDMLFFFGVIVVGFIYLWRFGYLDWVRTLGSHTAGETDQAKRMNELQAARTGAPDVG